MSNQPVNGKPVSEKPVDRKPEDGKPEDGETLIIMQIPVLMTSKDLREIAAELEEIEKTGNRDIARFWHIRHPNFQAQLAFMPDLDRAAQQRLI